MYWIPFVTKSYQSSASLTDIYNKLSEETCENLYQVQRDSVKKFTGSVYMDSFKILTSGQPRLTLRPVAIGITEEIDNSRRIKIFYRPTISTLIFLCFCIIPCFIAIIYILTTSETITPMPFLMILLFIIIAYGLLLIGFNMEISRFDKYFKKL